MLNHQRATVNRVVRKKIMMGSHAAWLNVLHDDQTSHRFDYRDRPGNYARVMPTSCGQLSCGSVVLSSKLRLRDRSGTFKSNSINGKVNQAGMMHITETNESDLK